MKEGKVRIKHRTRVRAGVSHVHTFSCVSCGRQLRKGETCKKLKACPGRKLDRLKKGQVLDPNSPFHRRKLKGGRYDNRVTRSSR